MWDGKYIIVSIMWFKFHNMNILYYLVFLNLIPGRRRKQWKKFVSDIIVIWALPFLH